MPDVTAIISMYVHYSSSCCDMPQRSTWFHPLLSLVNIQCPSVQPHHLQATFSTQWMSICDNLGHETQGFVCFADSLPQHKGAESQHARHPALLGLIIKTTPNRWVFNRAVRWCNAPQAEPDEYACKMNVLQAGPNITAVFCSKAMSTVWINYSDLYPNIIWIKVHKWWNSSDL